MRRFRLTVRARLTILYAGMFFLAGVILVALVNVALRQELARQSNRRAGMLRTVRDDLDADDLTRVVSPADNPLQPLVVQLDEETATVTNTVLLWSIVALVLLGLAAFAIGWILAGRVLSPLHTITNTARRIADRNLHERIALEGPPDEIKELADTFDAMLARLDHAFDGQKLFIGNASHELRTPLTVARTLIEVSMGDPDATPEFKRLGRTLLDLNERHTHLIDGLLMLAMSQRGTSVRQRVDFAEIVARAASDAQDESIEMRLSLKSVIVDGDPVLLERLAFNLVDNAVRYNIAHVGWVSIAVERAGADAVLTVANSGPEMFAHEIPALFEPFRRQATAQRHAHVPGSRIRGAGLGLSIVRSVVHAHAGEVAAEPRTGGGLIVYVTLPCVGEQETKQ
ncbi:ATP-binding protein [Hoyosella sp. YIM 151337]|uniref:sensor histidine kinase n=1 Tax=Hoyosella sp. YIM 151337 TaxID=2992742 RepID=UPI002235D47D|nr:ATP-binding protein [Hoyosella sp. YIM 151337]MCW4354065.1 ATP-binding protein [Hoyosella sp. YIM 151337]